MFRYFKQRKALKREAKALYEAAVVQARLPVFYDRLDVPDTVDGRFEMVALHCYILMHRLQKAGRSKLSQALFDAFFVNMDRSLREMGVGDLGVPKHMKRMMQGFNGRREAYEKSIKTKDRESLEQALIRNVYGTIDSPSLTSLSILMSYVEESVVMESGFALIELMEEKRA